VTITVLPRYLFIGENLASALQRVVEELRAERVLVVTDPVVSQQPFFSEAVNALKHFVSDVVVFRDVEPEPAIETARRVAKLARDHKVDMIVAIGGGSVIDAAKAGWLIYERPDADPESINPFTYYGLGRLAKLVAIPTTSGTGSDASFGVVLTKVDNGRRKLAMGSLELVPYATVLDVATVESLPRHLTLYTGVDALAHAVEAYVAVNANPFSDALAEKVVEIVFSDLPRILRNPGDREARLRMHVAATMAGMAFTAAGLGVAHAVAHAIGPLLKLHHGLSVGLALPYAVEYNEAVSGLAASKYRRLKLVVESLAGREARPTLRDHILKLYEDTGFPRRVSELPDPPSRGEWDKLVPKAVEMAMQDPELAFNPAAVGPDEIRKILERMY
jgi:alcohol dehydrogenase class IV